MKILFDHLCFCQRFGGVPRYYVELIKHLPSDVVSLSVDYSNNEYLKELDIKTKSFLNNYNFKGKCTAEREFGKLFSIPRLIRSDFDIYHPTHYDCYGFKYLKKNIRTVTTIHDMNFFTIPQFYTSHSQFSKQQKKIAHKVSHIITISQNTKNDLCSLWNLPVDKISVIYHGIDHERYKASFKTNIHEPYFLYVGARNQYKNFENLIISFSRLHKHFPEIKLYCAGAPFTGNELKQFNHLDIAESVHSFQASDEELINLYKNAIGFIFPSYYEGFGLPILEAMASECPVLLSNTSCFPEIAGDAGLYFDPYQIDDIYEKMKLIVLDTELRQSLINRGNTRVQDFSWEKCAAQHLEVYKSLL